jgi:hypothetical protein
MVVAATDRTSQAVVVIRTRASARRSAINSRTTSHRLASRAAVITGRYSLRAPTPRHPGPAPTRWILSGPDRLNRQSPALRRRDLAAARLVPQPRYLQLVIRLLNMLHSLELLVGRPPWAEQFEQRNLGLMS